MIFKNILLISVQYSPHISCSGVDVDTGHHSLQRKPHRLWHWCLSPWGCSSPFAKAQTSQVMTWVLAIMGMPVTIYNNSSPTGYDVGVGHHELEFKPHRFWRLCWSPFTTAQTWQVMPWVLVTIYFSSNLAGYDMDAGHHVLEFKPHRFWLGCWSPFTTV